MSYHYEVVGYIPDGYDDVTLDVLGEFESMMQAMRFANAHNGSKVYIVLQDASGVDYAELPVHASKRAVIAC